MQATTLSLPEIYEQMKIIIRDVLELQHDAPVYVHAQIPTNSNGFAVVEVWYAIEELFDIVLDDDLAMDELTVGQISEIIHITLSEKAK